ncbi:MAG: hypothetical protein H6707_14780 [Deltaproteobacteria bacterium]|nr:hypothetical protein [Deltaproteobacteria bacterium]
MRWLVLAAATGAIGCAGQLAEEQDGERNAAKRDCARFCSVKGAYDRWCKTNCAAGVSDASGDAGLADAGQTVDASEPADSDASPLRILDTSTTADTAVAAGDAGGIRDTGSDAGQSGACYGAACKPTGAPIGGGLGYPDIKSGGDYLVATPNELLSALAAARSGETVYVKSGAEIDLSDRHDITVGEGVTLAGDRGRNGAAGPRLFSRAMANSSVLLIAKARARISGLRIVGPDVANTDVRYSLSPFVKGSEEQSNAKAIGVRGADVLIDNNLISNFHRVGVDVGKGTTRLRIHHNELRDIHAYPVLVVSDTTPPIDIAFNRIHWIWHAIAGTGHQGTGYEARYNLFVAQPQPANWYSRGAHAFDVHPDPCIRAARDHYIAASTLTVHHNTFVNETGETTYEDAKFRGVPDVVAHLHHNRFANSDPAMAVSTRLDGSGQFEPGNLRVHDNLYAGKLIQTPPQALAQINFVNPPGPTCDLALLSGEVPIDVKISVQAPLSVRQVSFIVDGQTIFNGSQVPLPGAVTFNASALDHSRSYSELRVRVVDSRGLVSSHRTVFATQ